MIIFGTRTKILKNNFTSTYDCPNCGSKDTVQFVFASRYFHIFWIPIFSTSKTGVSQCSNCKQVRYPHEMVPQMKADYQIAATQAKRPFTQYTGALLIALLLVLIAIMVFFKSLHESQYIKAPEVNDIYTIHEDGKYKIYRIESIAGDSVTFQIHKMEGAKASEASTIKRKHAHEYSEERIRFSKADIGKMKSTRTIYSIDRNE